MTLMRAAMAAVLLALAATAQASTFEGVVQHVSDGDTVWVRPERGGPAIAVRLEGIDAPELCQPGGLKSREALASRVQRQRVRIEVKGKDDYDRLLARVERQGEDIGGWLVRQGHAWSYRYRGKSGSYADDERLARQARRGLWSAPDPMEPRVFRRFNGPCRQEAA